MAVFAFNSNLFAQGGEMHINREWRDYTGNPVFNPILNPFGLEWTKSIPSATAGLITVGHTQVSGQGENILLTKYDDGGSILWQVNYNVGGTRNEYGIDLKEDATTGYIYVCGTTDNGSTTNYDVVVLVYNSSGTLQYSTTYDVNGLNDIGTAINFDSNGYPIVCASSENSTTMSDFLVLSYDNTLSLLWNTIYDYSSLIDVPVGIEVISGKVLVAGASANSLTDWDYTVVEFDETTGSYLADTRDNISGVGYDQPFAFCKDASGNTYVTGRASTNGINYDVRTMKISPLNTIVWTQTFDGVGLEDIGNTIAVDGNGNVIVGGFTTKSNNKKDLLVLKYNSSGTLQWTQTQTSKDPAADAFVKKLVLNTGGDIYYIAGEKGIGANKQALVGKIKSSGKKSWERSIKGNYDYLPSDIQFGGGGGIGVYTIAIKDSTINVYETAYYTEMERDTARKFYGNGKPWYKKHEFAVQFKASAIDTTKINNKNITYGYLSDFLKSTSFSDFADYLRMDLSDVKAFKIHPNLTSYDTLSLSRTGNTVKLPPFYASLGLIFPSSVNDTLVERQLRNASQFVIAADLNYYLTLNTANDIEYTNGHSGGLDATVTYTNANINVSPAWAIETGNPNIIVGIFDSGINYSHADFNGSGLTSSKVTAGYDYYHDLPYLSSLPVDKYGHGTANAGIIGAIRNNTIGVSGIAGGDASSFPYNTGVSLHDMKNYEGNDSDTLGQNAYVGAGLITMERAMLDGALSSPTANIGQGQHAQNHSWAIANFFTPVDSVIWTLRNVMNTIFENEVVMGFPSGNFENSGFGTGNYSKPGNFKDEYCLNIGGIDGTGLRASYSSGGEYLDFVAPSTYELFQCLKKSGNGTTDSLTWGGPATAGAGLIAGTSYAAPHAVGVAALILSYVNNHPLKPNNIAPEDIEKIMEKTATDINGVAPYGPNYDLPTGHGRINAGGALQQIKIPNYLVKHYNINTTIANTSTTLVGSLESAYFKFNYLQFPQGNAVVNRYKVSYTNSHSLSGAYTIIDAWKRDAVSNLPGIISDPIANNPFDDKYYIPNTTSVTLQSYNNSSALLEGYVYEIMVYDPVAFTYTSSGVWYPFDLNPTNPVKFAYTLHLKDPTVGIEEINSESGVSVYPNPANDKIIIRFDTDKSEKANVRITDVMGKLLFEETMKFDDGSKHREITTANLTNGIYFVTLNMDNGKKITFKQIIAH